MFVRRFITLDSVAGDRVIGKRERKQRRHIREKNSKTHEKEEKKDNLRKRRRNVKIRLKRRTPANYINFKK